jgi:autophagy-related protein 16
LYSFCRAAINPKKSTELEEKILTLKNELAEVYRTHGSNAQKLLDLNDKLTKQEAALTLKEKV